LIDVATRYQLTQYNSLCINGGVRAWIYHRWQWILNYHM
jgi:hypothetical protein